MIAQKLFLLPFANVVVLPRMIIKQVNLYLYSTFLSKTFASQGANQLTNPQSLVSCNLCHSHELGTAVLKERVKDLLRKLGFAYPQSKNQIYEASQRAKEDMKAPLNNPEFRTSMQSFLLASYFLSSTVH